MPTTSGIEPPVADRPLGQVRGLGRAITRWGSEGPGGSRRPDLPWRSTRDPWAVLISEVMAQQTQVARVVPAYHRFLARFPTPRACALAPMGAVVQAWDGLGYNRRARDLHRAAAVIEAVHGGAVPSTLAELLALPGVGTYTARAVLVFAFEVDVGVVDTNAGRVLSRAVAGRPLRATEAQALVDSMVPPGGGWAFGQAILDLGAVVCVARQPSCTTCPVRRRCRWVATGRGGPDPASGSAGVSVRQRAFAGSDRQGRGRLIASLRRGPVAVADLPAVMEWECQQERIERVVAGLVREGMVSRRQPGLLELA